MSTEEYESLCKELREINKWQKVQTLILGAIAAAVGVNLGGIV